MADGYKMEEAQKLFEEAYQKQMEGDVSEAILLYLKSLECYPSAEAHTFLGWAYSMQGHYDLAIEECRKAIELDPEFGNPYNDIGAYLIESGKAEEALPWLEKAVKAKRYDAYCYPYYNMGRVWEHKGDWFQALKCYKDALIENRDYRLARTAQNRILSLMN